jgi:iron complex transport system ATP-binding protein
MAYVPQVHVPPFPYTVADIVRLGRLPHHGVFGAPGAADRRCVAESIEQMGLSALAQRPYTEISGGERQLVLIARALAQGARYLILDEPAGGLDYGNQFRLLSRLQSLGGAGFGVLFTTHHPDHALQAAQHVVLLREGRIVSAGDPQILLTSAAIADLYSIPQLTIERQRTLQ